MRTGFNLQLQCKFSPPMIQSLKGLTNNEYSLFLHVFPCDNSALSIYSRQLFSFFFFYVGKCNKKGLNPLNLMVRAHFDYSEFIL